MVFRWQKKEHILHPPSNLSLSYLELTQSQLKDLGVSSWSMQPKLQIMIPKLKSKMAFLEHIAVVQWASKR